MRGLPFPQDAAFPRALSHESATPASDLDIPIDPALAEPPIDPALQDSSQPPPNSQVSTPPPLDSYLLHHPRDYSQGPQGDPFAQDAAQPFFTVEEHAEPTPKPLKRRRRPPRGPNCVFCGGDEKKNNESGQPESMASCDTCGRSSHISCMKLDTPADFLQSYPWKCAECKTCEKCQDKTDEAKMLFCDSCDRGWHVFCLTPPLDESPPGKWFCPICTGDPAGVCEPLDLPVSEQILEAPPELDHENTIRASSIASSSHPGAPPSVKTYLTKRKRGRHSVNVVASGSESEKESEPPETPFAPRVRTRTTSATHTTRKSTRAAQAEEEPSSPLRRPQLKLVPPRRMTVKLRIPPTAKGKEREESSEDESQQGLFDFLTEEDRDISRTTISQADKARFDRSRHIAEIKLVPPEPKTTSGVPDSALAGPSTRPLRSSALSMPTIPLSGLGRSESPSTPGPPTTRQGQRINTIRFGAFDIQTWFDAPFPEEYSNIPDGRLWICEFCLKYMKSRFNAARHKLKCKYRHPPGDEIYREGNISIFEVDGRRNKIYCQNLCLLSKMFLDHKSLFYDVEPFLFYIMTEMDDAGAHFVGYFSKEKRSPKDYNVSCIMTLPVRQRQGWGNLLIEFSYLLSKKERRLGSPEKPLSGLGALGYRNYWTLSVMRYLHTASREPRLEDICRATSMTAEDVYNTLNDNDLITTDSTPRTPVRPLPGQSIKFPKGRRSGIARRHLVRAQTNDDESAKGPFMPPAHYEIHWDKGRVASYLAKWESKGYLKIKPEKLKWSTFLFARVKKSAQTGDEDDLAMDGETEDGVITGYPVTEPPESLAEVDGRDEDVDADADVDEDVDEDVEDAEVASTTLPTRRPSSRSPFKRVTLSPEQPTLRRLRSQGNADILPVLSHSNTMSRTRSRTRSTSPAKKAAVTPRPRPVPIRTSSLSPRKSSKADLGSDDILDADAALAARLAMEEMPRRTLRSQSTSALDLKRSASATSRSAGRKRRRVESSPESDSDTSPVDEYEHMAIDTANPDEPVQVNGTQNTETSPPPPSSTLTNGILSSVHENDAPYLSVEVTVNGHPREDTDCGASSVGGRHSVPSDDTVCVLDTNTNLDKMMDSPIEVQTLVSIDRQSAEVGTSIPPEEMAMDVNRTNLDGWRPATLSAYSDPDADAEGEDEDAEGEPDEDYVVLS
ncbi:hypothetical protein OF83DRAFT_1125219 [Amylostereum chailletii]|nr:hypothetical protein OF83DRAFT_1125219 [Amylostereum chailletii]